MLQLADQRVFADKTDGTIDLDINGITIIDIIHRRQEQGINSLADWIASHRQQTDAIQLPAGGTKMSLAQG